MLQAKTEEQLKHVVSLLGEHPSVIEQDESGLYLDDFITFDTMAKIVDYLRSSTDKKKDLFEECWVAYRRKGVKQKARQYWNKLNENEMDLVLPHIKAYVSTRDIQYQKDFERYLRDKVFKEVVYNGNNLVYDPTKNSGEVESYNPTCGGALMYNEYYKCFMYTGVWYGSIADGYTDDNRPDRAEITLNNGRGTVVWSREYKKWNICTK